MANFSDESNAVFVSSEMQKDAAGQNRLVYVRTTGPLVWLIRCGGKFTQDGFVVSHVTPGGPATRMTSLDGTLTNVSMQEGDTVVSINDLAILTDIDWSLALLKAPNHQHVKFTIVDVNSGEANDWLVTPQLRPGTTPPAGGIAPIAPPVTPTPPVTPAPPVTPKGTVSVNEIRGPGIPALVIAGTEITPAQPGILIEYRIDLDHEAVKQLESSADLFTVLLQAAGASSGLITAVIIVAAEVEAADATNGNGASIHIGVVQAYTTAVPRT